MAPTSPRLLDVETPGQPAGPAPRSAPPTAGRGLLIILCVPMFLVLLDVMAMNVAMPTIGRTFSVPTGEWARVVDAYTVPLALGLVPGGWVVDRWGPRRILLMGLVVFTLASALGGIAPGWSTVLLARLGQGAAAAVMLPAGLAAISTAWQEEVARARALGAWSGISAAATAVGPAVGGLLVAAASWRAVFWVNVPLGLAALWGTAARVRDGHRAAERGRPGALLPLCASILVAGMMTSGANGTLQVVTVHLQQGLGLAPGPAGLVLLLATAPFVVLGPVAGRLVVRWGRREVAAAGFGLGGAGLMSLGHGSGAVTVVPGLLGIGFGLGLMTSAIVGESLDSWSSRTGLAGGLNNTLRQVGTSVGVAVGAAATAHWTGAGLLTRTGAVAGLWWWCAAVIVLIAFARGRGGRRPRSGPDSETVAGSS